MTSQILLCRYIRVNWKRLYQNVGRLSGTIFTFCFNCPFVGNHVPPFYYVCAIVANPKRTFLISIVATTTEDCVSRNSPKRIFKYYFIYAKMMMRFVQNQAGEKKESLCFHIISNTTSKIAVLSVLFRQICKYLHVASRRPPFRYFLLFETFYLNTNSSYSIQSNVGRRNC